MEGCRSGPESGETYRRTDGRSTERPSPGRAAPGYDPAMAERKRRPTSKASGKGPGRGSGKLAEYKAKRDFSKTPEPSGDGTSRAPKPAAKARPKGRYFCVQTR